MERYRPNDTSTPATSHRRGPLLQLTTTREATPAPRRGDVLFGTRGSWVQRTANVSKDPWTHAALLTVTNGRLTTVELGPKGLFSRSYEEFSARYRYVGIARPQMCAHCLDAVVTSAEDAATLDAMKYSWTNVTLLEAIALARTIAPAQVEPAVLGVAKLLGRGLQSAKPVRFTCSGFIDYCLAQACGRCRPESTWPRRGRLALWRALPAVETLRSKAVAATTDPELVRVFTSPSDLWVANCWSARWVVRPDASTVLLDMAVDERRLSEIVRIAEGGPFADTRKEAS